MPIVAVDKPTLDDKFQQYHEDNPHVYETLVRLARRMKARSRYARLIMDQEPDLAGIFETRELRP
ncbi:MAG: hypothetical protein K6T78_15875 [Alicyclobacillus sp.]|nr:hypothetical protein [Alicyclobacillus sp.]